MNEELKEKICKLSDENELRDIRDYADARLQQVKEEKAFAKKEILEAKYKDKYLVKYGSSLMKSGTLPNKDDITIIHVLDIAFQGRDFFRCHAKVIHIKYDDDMGIVGHLSAAGYNDINIQCYEDSQYDLHESDIAEIIDQNKANQIIAEAKEFQKEIMKNWNL